MSAFAPLDGLADAQCVALAHPGNGPHVRQTALALYERGMLDYVATTFMDHPDFRLARALRAVAARLSPKLARELGRRAFSELPIGKFRTYPAWELLRTASARFSRSAVLTDTLWERAEIAFTRHAARGLHPPTQAIYAYEHAALELLQAARRQGIVGFYEQPSQHHSVFSRLLAEIETYDPASLTEATRTVHSADRHARRNGRRDEELRLADWVMVNSSFTRRTLVQAGIPEEKVLVTPLGFPEVHVAPRERAGPLRALHAGTQGIRKGTHLLHAAWRGLAPTEASAELWLIGNSELPHGSAEVLPGRVVIEGRIPYDELMARMDRADLFVLPTLADGFGMVITEAMSRGLPVLTTENCAGPDLITHGENGWIVPAGDRAALEAQLRWCIAHPEEVRAAGQRAAKRARRWQWTDYRDAIAGKIAEKIEEQRQTKERTR